ncbi:DegT/DnrJ/EryC1/StrS family aminotransferase, partial [Chromobacterium piscinae]
VTSFGSQLHIQEFCVNFSEYLGLSNSIVIPCSTGEEALYWALKSVLFNAISKKVLVCGFNCSVVFRSVNEAGGELIKFDRPKPEDYSAAIMALILNEKPSVLIITHFFGAPEDFSELITFCNHHGVFIIEDCAHCLGGKIKDLMVGTLADASIFSFNYDKPISLLGGGLLVLRTCYEPNLIKSGYLKGGLYKKRQKYEKISVFLMMKWLYWRRNSTGIMGIPNRILLRLLGNHIIHFNRKIPLGPIRSHLGVILLSRYKQVQEIRNNNASRICFPHQTTGWQYAPTVKPAWLKQKCGPFRLQDISRIERTARDHSLRIGNFNWPDIFSEDSTSNRSNMEFAKHWIDIPVHQNLTDSHLQTINRLLHDE